MTPEELSAKLDTPNADVTLADNGGWLNVHVTRHHNGHRYSHNARVDLDASDEQIENIRQIFAIWWADTIRDQ